MEQWYAVHTLPRGEEKAQRHLENQGHRVYCPQYMRRRSHARRVDWVPAPLFPRYLFVRMDITQARWRAVHSTVGVSHLVCQGDVPIPVPDSLIAEILSREDETGKVVIGKLMPFKKGDRVQFVSGPLAEQTGLFDCASDEERVFVLLNLLGRQVRVRMPIDAVTLCA